MGDLEHVLHASVIVSVAYVIMLYVLKQGPQLAETRSLALGSAALAYMLIFGHKLPELPELK